jgi:ATP-binding cassette subfamily B (MDR/TAP) protein 1
LVQQALEVASRSRTTVCIAHRLSTIKNADNIIVMSRGEIVEQGTHDDLYARDGMYRGLVDAQRISAQHTGAAGEITPEETDDDENLVHRSPSDQSELLRRTTTGGSRITVNQNNLGVVEKKKYSGVYLLKRVHPFRMR